MFNALIRAVYRVAHRGLRLLRSFDDLRQPERSWRSGTTGTSCSSRNSYRAQLTLPGVYIRPREDRRTAAARELREEVGINVQPGLVHAYHGTHVFEHRQDTLDIYELEVDTAPNVQVDNREVVRAEFLTPAEALSMPIVPHLDELSLQTNRAGDGLSPANPTKRSGVRRSGSTSATTASCIERFSVCPGRRAAQDRAVPHACRHGCELQARGARAGARRLGGRPCRRRSVRDRAPFRRRGRGFRRLGGFSGSAARQRFSTAPFYPSAGGVRRLRSSSYGKPPIQPCSWSEERASKKSARKTHRTMPISSSSTCGI